jgi:outer membrane receptor protein involved in Fe transport|tara:strand:- start:3169 stop:5919 length:2751 start_codon:yes stop_codon:yes gene_type:complete
MSRLKHYLKNSLLFSIVFISFAASSQVVEEVVVTATKKAESTQDLALSIEALTADQLAIDQVYDVTDLAEVIPGLEVAKTIGSGSAWTIRGMGSFGIGAGVIASVVTSVNGHSVNDSVVSDLGFMDLERVEVLKGPQGTLFGRNAANGVINLVTARPKSELGGSFDVEMGNYNKRTTKAVINVPLSDVVRTRLAVMSNTRDGMVQNLNTGNFYDDRNDVAFRLSMDWDISDVTELKLTYSQQDSDDNRPQEEVTFCRQDRFYGCNPYVRGEINTAADTRGHIAGFFGFLAGTYNGSIANSYAPTAADSFGGLYLDREPTHKQKQTVANLELNHEINDDLRLIAKYSYETREFNVSGDNDGSISPYPLTGIGASLGLPPLVANLCFGGDVQFCESVDSERTYDFSDVYQEGQQAEINLVSDYDGPINYTVGLYMYDDRNDNTYRAQTAGSQFYSSFSNHPYYQVVLGLTGNDFGNKAGVAFYQNLLAMLAALGNLQANPTLANASAFAQATAATAANPDFTIPFDLTGVVNDQHVRTKSKALYGELYIDLSEKNKLTLGARYNDDKSASKTYNDTAGQAWVATQGWNVENRDDLPFVDYSINADDAIAYKVAFQHDVSDDVMLYASYTTAVKAGGVNAGDNPTLYDQEEAGVLDLGFKGILLDGAMLLNMNVFQSNNDGFLVAAVQDTGTQNENIDAEFTGFEGNMAVYLSETTKFEMNWLFLDHKVVSNTSLINYLNPTGSPKMADIPLELLGGTGLLTGAVHENGRTLFKSGGFNCTGPLGAGFACSTGIAGWEESIYGNSLPGSADVSYSMALSKAFNNTNGMTTARLAYRYRGEFNADIFNMSRFEVPENKTWDLLIRHDRNDADWYVSLYAKNLSDDRHLNYLRPASNVQGGQLFGSFTDPRTFGLQFGTSF